MTPSRVARFTDAKEHSTFRGIQDGAAQLLKQARIADALQVTIDELSTYLRPSKTT